MKQDRDLCSIILAAGKGTRIGLTKTHKTCLPVRGRPVIVRSMEAYKAAGISAHVVVLGKGAQSVLTTVGRAFSDILFAYQTEPRGTGDAAKCGANVLNAIGYEGDVLAVAGDKLVEAKLVRRMIRKFRSSKLDCLFLVGRREDSPSSGRVILDQEDQPVRIVETADIRRARVLSQILERAQASDLPPEFVAQAIATEGMSQNKARVAFGALYDFSTRAVSMAKEDFVKLIPKKLTSFKVAWGKGSKRISPEEADAAELVNLSLYLLTSEALKFAVKKLSAENAQGEEYLSDIIAILAAAKNKNRGRFKLATESVRDPHEVMGFNNLDELRAIEEYVRGKEGWG